MSDLIRWEPSREMRAFRDAVDRLFEDFFVHPISSLGVGPIRDLALDVYETDDDVIIKATIPGVKAEDLDISIASDALTIRGETREESEVREENYLHRERRFGSFHRSVRIPVPVVADDAEAVIEDGILELRIPKAEGVKPKAITVKAKKSK